MEIYRNVRIYRVLFSELEGFLHLSDSGYLRTFRDMPKDAKIVAVDNDPTRVGSVMITVESREFDPIREDATPPQYTAGGAVILYRAVPRMTQEEWVNQFREKSPHQPTIQDYMTSELSILMEVFSSMGHNPTPSQVIVFWEHWSDSRGASWTSGTEDTIRGIVAGFFRDPAKWWEHPFEEKHF